VSSASRAVRGVPRLEELTRVTTNVKAPSMNIFIKPQYNQNKEEVMKIKNKIETTYFKDVVKYSRIYYDPDDFKTTIEDDQHLIDLYKEYQIEERCNTTDTPWLLRLEMDERKMRDLDLTMIDVHHALDAHFNQKEDRISCMFSDDNATNLVFRIRINQADIKNPDMLTELKALESTLMESIILKGIEKVNKVEMLKKDELMYNELTKTFEKQSQWYMDTDGTNLIEMLSNPFVDATRTVSNDVNEIYEIFGVEAARQCLLNEINDVINDKNSDPVVNFRHLNMLVDTMTSRGTLMSIDRHGINKGDIGPLAKCSFEEVNNVLIKAGVFTEVDKVNGVSANIILGQVAPCGTGDTQILIDEAKLQEGYEEYEEEVDAVDTSMVDYDDDYREAACAVDNIGFDFVAPLPDKTIEKKPEIEVSFV
jgi:DNA-directed RNA polymerase II subunit RPB1